MNKRVQGILYMIGASIGYGFLSIFIKLGINSGLNGLYISGVAFLLAAILLWSMVFISKKKIYLSLVFLNICAIANIAIFYFQVKAVQTISVSLFTILYYTYPFFIIIVSRFLLDQKVNKLKLLSLTLSIFGVVLTIGIFQNAFIKFSVIGIIYALLSAFSNSIFFISIQRALKENDDKTSLAYIYSVTTVVYLATCLFTGQLTNLPNVTQISYIILLAVVSFTFAGIFNAKGIELIGASTASIISLIQPIIVLVVANMIFGDLMTVMQMFGGVLIILSLVVTIFDKE